MLRNRYETAYGIFNHHQENIEEPMPLIGFRQAESPEYRSSMRSRMEKFVEYEVGKWFNMSWDEFIKHPRHEILMMLDVSRKKIEAVSKATTNALNNLNVPTNKS